MNEQVPQSVKETAEPTVTIDAAEYARILAKLDQLGAEVEETSKLLKKAAGQEQRSEWYRKPGRFEGQMKWPDDFFDDLTDDDYRTMGFDPDEL